MRQKKIFKRRHNRHPIKWTMISAGLFTLIFSSFSAGVQFGQMETDTRNSNYAKLDVRQTNHDVAQANHETRIAHSSNQ
jgi:hypothetical protein